MDSEDQGYQQDAGSLSHRSVHNTDGQPVYEDPYMPAEEFNCMNLDEKIKAVRAGRYFDPIWANGVKFMGIGAFVFNFIAGYYVNFYLIMPSRYEDSWLLMVRCMFTWIAVQVITNWVIVVMTDTIWRPQRGHVPSHSGPIGQPKKIKSRGMMLDYEPDPGTGLRWRFCIRCKHDAPPRCHHCPLCDACYLRRDHHCFFTGCCVGLRTQRPFIPMVIYATLACGWVALFVPSYLYFHPTVASPESGSYSSLFFPVTLYRYLWSKTVSRDFFLAVTQLYCQPIFALMCGAYVILEMVALVTGRTLHEVQTGRKVDTKTSLIERIRSVLGPYWLMNMIFPTQLLWPTKRDGVMWPGVRDRTSGTAQD